MPDSNKLYGISTIFDDPAGELINPRKMEEQVLKETEKGHQNCIVSRVSLSRFWDGKFPGKFKTFQSFTHSFSLLL